MGIRTLGPGSLKIGEVATQKEFATDLSKAALTPSTDSEDDVPLLDGSNMTGEDTNTWALSGTLYQSYDFQSLEKWCYDNRGLELPFVFVPNNEGGIDWSGVVKIRPITIGGDVKKKNTSDFEFPLVGEPVPAEVV